MAERTGHGAGCKLLTGATGCTSGGDQQTPRIIPTARAAENAVLFALKTWEKVSFFLGKAVKKSARERLRFMGGNVNFC
jgi:hypothetical protein